MSRRERTLKQRVMQEVDTALRDALRLQRKALTEFIRARNTERRNRVAAARTKCAMSLTRAKARAAAIRAEARVRAQQAIAASKDACQRNVNKAKQTGTKAVAEAKRERAAALNDERRIKAGPNRLYLTKAERRRESDDEVLANLPKELHQAWQATKRQFKPKPRESRLEQFLRWVEEHPDEVLQQSMQTADEYVAEAERELARVERALKRGQAITADDLVLLGTSRAELESVGFNADDPSDVAEFLRGYANFWNERTLEEEPF